MSKQEKMALGNLAKLMIGIYEIRLEYCKLARKLFKDDYYMQTFLNLDELEQYYNEIIERWKQYAK